MAHNVPLVVNYLLTHSFGDLFTEHGVNVRPSADGSKFSLNYDQIEAKNGDPIAECCRGLVIRPIKRVTIDSCYNGAVGEVEVLAWPMDRFYNACTPEGDVVDWSDPGLVVSEKIDGTCCILFWDPQYVQWCVATRSVPDADVVIKNGDVVHGDMTFSKLFWIAYNNTAMGANGEVITVENVGLNKEFTYIFELTSRYNRVVVDYDEPKITLLAMRDIVTGRELDVRGMAAPKFLPRPVTFTCCRDGLHEAIELANSYPPSQMEGVVACDSKFRRVKVKSRAYVLSAKVNSYLNDSLPRVLETIIGGTIDDVVAHVDQTSARKIEMLVAAYKSFTATVNKNFKKWKDECGDDRKAFALKVTSSAQWSAPYFSLWKSPDKTITSIFSADLENKRLSRSTLDHILSAMNTIDGTITGDTKASPCVNE